MAKETTKTATATTGAKSANSKRVGQVLLSKSGRKYIKLEQNISKDDVIFLNKPAEEIDFLVDSGRITAEEGQARKEKVPDFVLANLVRGNTTKDNNAEGF